MRRIRSIFWRQFITAAVPVTILYLLIAVFSQDFKIVSGGWLMNMEIIACFNMNKKINRIRKYCPENDDIRVFSRKNLPAAIVCVLVATTLIVAVKLVWDKTFLARGIMLTIPLVIIVCQKRTLDALADKAVKNLISTSKKIHNSELS